MPPPNEWDADDTTLEVMEGRIDGRLIVILKIVGPDMRHFLVFDDAAELGMFAQAMGLAARKMAEGNNGQTTY